ncbi:hypothetical protein E2C01_045622 [Portunus trituberculatus]|uniref:Uncharacterized protein n=1 Tax=Portunus trituberculatus TaxID=210409 RepID=A0A5B7G3M5_PORTR|nr:hypothetical protein [Portunus trituberculatus]
MQCDFNASTRISAITHAQERWRVSMSFIPQGHASPVRHLPVLDDVTDYHPTPLQLSLLLLLLPYSLPSLPFRRPGVLPRVQQEARAEATKRYCVADTRQGSAAQPASEEGKCARYRGRGSQLCQRHQRNKEDSISGPATKAAGKRVLFPIAKWSFALTHKAHLQTSPRLANPAHASPVRSPPRQPASHPCLPRSHNSNPPQASHSGCHPSTQLSV